MLLIDASTVQERNLENVHVGPGFGWIEVGGVDKR